MSDMHLNAAPFATFIGALWLALAPAHAETPCQPIPNGFEFCTAGTIWQDAESFGFDDGIALETDALWLEIMPLPDEMAAASLETMLETLEAEFVQQATDEGQRAPEVLNRDSFQTSHLNAAMLTMTEFDNGDEYVVVSAVAQGAGRQLILALDSDATISASEMEMKMRNIAELIRPAQGG